ncbi:ABC transporter substrate-binding protein [Bradyrhizobium sp. CCBAU 51627]|uniref:ABC transporter substrate-binding protein n=1 Tax=Bradyrhizobium sp. CCBAU 51627 TaxID=1325088 RepID=UPI002306B096|nr:ABC transporter substrate-binding protein [Bradyrhizobium sp. CCBAU 51627]
MVTGALAAAGFAAGALLPPRPAFASEQLTIISWGGGYQDVQLRKSFFEPFTKATGIKITEDQWNGEVSKVRAMVQTNTVNWDVLDVGVGIGELCSHGLVETLNWNRLGLDRTKFLGDDKTLDCGVPHHASSTVIAYDRTKLKNGPKTIADFFDLQKFPGKRAMQKGPTSNLEWALVADGVLIKDVYKVLATPAGVDRAFKKLDTIKKDVIWWTAGTQPAQLLGNGQVVMSTAWSGSINNAVKESGLPLEIMWDAQMLSLDFWVIPKGARHLDEAYKFLAFGGSPKPQADMTRYGNNGPANKDAMALVDPTIGPNLTTSPAHMANSLEFDYSFWGDKRDELNQRFTAWVVQQ